MARIVREQIRESPAAKGASIAERPVLRAVNTERSSHVYQQVRELFITGQLKPGERIIERDLVELLGVSRTPVRTALHRLQQEGYVVGVHKGQRQYLIVTPLTAEDAGELLEMVGALEGIAIRRVVRLEQTQRDVIVDHMRRLNKALAAAADRPKPDSRRISEIDERLHRIFFLHGAGARLSAMHASLQPQTYRFRRVHHSQARELTPQSVIEHNQIIVAIERGDALSAMLSVHKNWRNAAGRVRKVLAHRGEEETPKRAQTDGATHRK